MSEGAPAQLVARAAAGPESPPRLADVCRRVLLTRIAQAWGRAEALDEDGAIAEFRSPVRALGAALRIQNDLADLNRDLPPERRRLFRIGVALGGAAAHCARAEPGGICADDGVLAAAAGRLDMESTDLGPLRAGSQVRAHAVASTLKGRVFRYKQWTTPGRRRLSLIVASALVAALIVAMATDMPRP